MVIYTMMGNIPRTWYLYTSWFCGISFVEEIFHEGNIKSVQSLWSFCNFFCRNCNLLSAKHLLFCKLTLEFPNDTGSCYWPSDLVHHSSINFRNLMFSADTFSFMPLVFHKISSVQFLWKVTGPNFLNIFYYCKIMFCYLSSSMKQRNLFL